MSEEAKHHILHDLHWAEKKALRVLHSLGILRFTGIMVGILAAGMGCRDHLTALDEWVIMGNSVSAWIRSAAMLVVVFFGHKVALASLITVGSSLAKITETNLDDLIFAMIDRETCTKNRPFRRGMHTLLITWLALRPLALPQWVWLIFSPLAAVCGAWRLFHLVWGIVEIMFVNVIATSTMNSLTRSKCKALLRYGKPM